MASAGILVINPNSNPEVTAGLREAAHSFVQPGGPAIDCVGLPEGPFGIESEADAVAVVPLLEARIRAESALAFVIACYSDPGSKFAGRRRARPSSGSARAPCLRP